MAERFTGSSNVGVTESFSVDIPWALIESLMSKNKGSLVKVAKIKVASRSNCKNVKNYVARLLTST